MTAQVTIAGSTIAKSANVYAHVQGRVREALSAMQAAGQLPADLAIGNFDVDAPRDASHGDLACNAAMVLAKPAKMKPRDIAEALAAKLREDGDVAKAEVAGPGFLNITFTPRFWQDVVATILAQGPEFGRTGTGRGERINVEYVSANPTGPMHVGHCRGAVFGDALANLLAFAGWDVTREYYINDAGGQVNTLARSTFLRYREALGEDIGEIPDGLYPGEYLKPVGEALAKEHGPALINMPEERWLPIVRDAAMAPMLQTIKDDLAALNITHDVFFSERSLTADGKDQVKAAMAVLRDKGLIYEGRLPKPKGHDDEDWEDREQTLFKSTDFGDDEDRALMKSDGNYTYFAGDVAYHFDKLQRGYRQLVNVFGADHSGYVKRIKAVVKALSGGEAEVDIPLINLVTLSRAGVAVKMSKRAGTIVTLREVVDEVGRDPVRFMMLYRENNKLLDFDFAKVVEKSKDNPVFYVQYAHARSASVFRNVLQTFPDLTPDSVAAGDLDLTKLDDPGELQIVKALALFPKLASDAARAHEPHRLAFYLFELASAFHSQWTRGNDLPQLRFIQEGDRSLTAARCAMVAATQRVLSSGLAVLGVEAPLAMR
ncbi:MAG: arginine--tRNA ligase [Hyphomicrobiaceae bacterium]|nr:arginine--tRNA ligase [Hyphomicrobiaceae bacterium]